MDTAHRHTLFARLRDTRGASIVLALLFFMICAIIGSVVLTAASVQMKGVQTHKELQQDEFTVGSAAQTLGYDMDMAQLTVVPGAAGDSVTCTAFSQFGQAFWAKRGSDVLKARAAHESYKAPDKLMITEGETTVYGSLTVDADLNIEALLSLDENLSPTSPYNMRVSIQCIPTYDGAGTLVSFEYERAVITKASGGGAS